jgi:HAD superfamily hydrolase (TIGR01509 family)
MRLVIKKMITKIVSGGQTGADRAALDFAIKNNIPHGGWLPKYRKAEDGPLPDYYRLREMKTVSYIKRTEQNVIDSDGTLIISHGKLTGGSALTRQFAKRHKRPWLHIDLNKYSDLVDAAVFVSRWIAENVIKVLNVAGPRASKDAYIYSGVRKLLEKSIIKKTPIEVVLFDFGGVLSEEGWKKGLRVIAKANDLDVDKFIQAAADMIYETGYITGKCSGSYFWNTLKRKTGIKGNNAFLTHELMSRFILNDRMIDLVKKLRSEKLTVGILSDQTDWLDTLNARFDFFKYFDHVFNSYHLGKGKRDISLFDDIAGFLKTPPDRILFIDDDPGNVARARQKGWRAILYVNDKSFRLEFNKISS